MKRAVYIFVCAICLWFVYRSFNLWQGLQTLEYKDSINQKEIEEIQSSLNNLRLLPNRKICMFEENYRNLDRKTRLFSRYYNLKMALETEKINKNGLITQLTSPSKWLGIEQINLSMHFYELKDISQYITIFNFLEKLEISDPLKISNIIQKNNQLEVQLQLYGRRI